MLKHIVLFLVILNWHNVSLADGVLDSIDDLSKGTSLSVAQREEGRKTLLLLVANCEFDEGCLLNHIPLLKEQEAKTPNPMYVGFINYLKDQKDKLEKNHQRCQSDEKKASRRVYAECLKARIISEGAPMAASTRSKIDKLDDNQDLCIKTNMEKLAATGNIFAQAHMVNLTQLMGDDKKMDYWYNLIQKQANTPQYQQFQSCPELP